MEANRGGCEYVGLQILVRRFDSGPGLHWLRQFTKTTTSESARHLECNERKSESLCRPAQPSSRYAR